MAEADRLRWNERHASAEEPGPPVARLAEHEALLHPGPGARALDVACGTGRNALYLAALGYAVDAWDVSDVGLARLTEAATARGLSERINTRQVDLDDLAEGPGMASGGEPSRTGGSGRAALPDLEGHPQDGTYDLVVDTYFLDRRLLPLLERLVKPGGLLFMETLLSTPERPGRPDFYLQPGELRESFPGLEVLFSREDQQEGWAALLARKAAVSRN